MPTASASEPNPDASRPEVAGESEQRLRLALETGQIGLWVWNSTDVANAGNWSPRLKEIFGLPPGTEVTHDLFLKCVHPEDRERVNAAVMAAISGTSGGRYQLEYRAIHADESVHWVTARGQAFFNPDGTPFRFIGTVMDITERKLAEQSIGQSHRELERRVAERTEELAQINDELRKEVAERKCAQAALERSKNDLRLAIDTIPGLVWTSLPDGNIEYLNKRWLEFTGLTQEQANGWGWQVAVHPDDLPGLVDYWKSILTSGEAGEYEARLRRFDGEHRWFLFRGVPLFDDEGKLVKWYGTNTDIEDRRASERVVRGHLGVLTHLLDVLGEESDPDQLPKHVVHTARRQLGAASVTIWERSDEQLDLLGIAEEGRFRTRREAGYFEGSLPVAAPAPPLWVEALRSGDHILIEDIDKEPSRIILADGRSAIWPQQVLTRPFAELKVQMREQGIRGLLIAPMLLAGELAGIIGIRFTGTRVFEREEIELTKALAHQATLATQMMRLSRESRRAAIESERNRLARDIHDTLAQGFTGVIVQLEAAEDASLRGLQSDSESHMRRAQELARESLQEARRSVHALRPQILARNDLCSAMTELIRKMTAGTALQANFRVEGSPPLIPSGCEDNLLRICQEVLTNTLRHASARHFTGLLTFAADAVVLQLDDDGTGFDPLGSHEGFGLLGMRERVQQMNGEWSIRSAPGQGTHVTVQLPAADREIATAP